MYKEEKLAIGISSTVIIIGFAIGALYGGEHFARSGAVVVCIAIYFATKYIEENLGTITGKVKDMVAYARDDVIGEMVSKDAMNKEQATKAYDNIQGMLGEKMTELVSNTKNRAIKVEAYLLILGTLIWGFGDLIDKII